MLQPHCSNCIGGGHLIAITPIWVMSEMTQRKVFLLYSEITKTKSNLMSPPGRSIPPTHWFHRSMEAWFYPLEVKQGFATVPDHMQLPFCSLPTYDDIQHCQKALKKSYVFSLFWFDSSTLDLKWNNHCEVTVLTLGLSWGCSRLLGWPVEELFFL